MPDRRVWIEGRRVLQCINDWMPTAKLVTKKGRNVFFFFFCVRKVIVFGFEITMLLAKSMWFEMEKLVQFYVRSLEISPWNILTKSHWHLSFDTDQPICVHVNDFSLTIFLFVLSNFSKIHIYTWYVMLSLEQSYCCFLISSKCLHEYRVVQKHRTHSASTNINEYACKLYLFSWMLYVQDRTNHGSTLNGK